MMFGVSRRKNFIRKMVREEFGKKRETSPDDAELQHIAIYDRICTSEDDLYHIDDITWNDLDGDTLYRQMNHTFSTPGETVLYHMLRKPLMNKESLATRQLEITYLEEHPELREKIQQVAAFTGKFRKTGETVFLENANQLMPLGAMGYRFMSLLPLLLLLFAFIRLDIGIIAAIAAMTINGILHAQFQRKLDVARAPINGAIAVIGLFEDMMKFRFPIPQKEYEEYISQRNILKRVRQKSFLMLRGVTTDMAFEILKMAFLLEFWSLDQTLAALKQHRDVFASAYAFCGNWDALCAIVSHRMEICHKVICTPEFIDASSSEPYLSITALYHPLIKKCIPNDICFEHPILLTGSNASGKSSWLKSLSLAALMSQTILFCHAATYVGIPLLPITSMALRDNLKDGDSYFVAEIRSLKRIFQLLSAKVPCLIAIDEILRGTNTIERIASSSAVLKQLATKWPLVIAATHDRELTELLSRNFSNYHFEEKYDMNDVIFDYLLKDGPATSRNAIRLLETMGMEAEVVAEATERADYYTDKGIWRMSHEEIGVMEC